MKTISHIIRIDKREQRYVCLHYDNNNDKYI